MKSTHGCELNVKQTQPPTVDTFKQLRWLIKILTLKTNKITVSLVAISQERPNTIVNIKKIKTS